MTKIIKSIKIQGIKHDIKLFNSNSREDDNMGRSDGKNGIISLALEMPKQIMTETLLHECIHLISDANSIKLKEKQIVALSTGINELLISNPKFVKRYIKK
jgi:hypothetical protein